MDRCNEMAVLSDREVDSGDAKSKKRSAILNTVIVLSHRLRRAFWPSYSVKGTNNYIQLRTTSTQEIPTRTKWKSRRVLNLDMSKGVADINF